MALAGSIRAGRAFIELVTNDDKLQKGLKRAQASLRAFQAQVDQLSTQFAKAGLTLAAPLALSAKIFAGFSDQISLVRAVAAGTRAELDELDRTAKRLGATTSFTAGQVAELMVELGRGGMAAREINAATKGVLDLARATGTETGTTAGIVVSALRAFNLGADEATRVADVLTAAANGSFNTLQSLGEAFTYAGVTAAQAGMSIEETAAILMALGNVGIQGSMAGTTLRRLLTITAAEAEKLTEIFGVQFRDAAGNARPLVDVMEEINRATKDLGSAERAAAFNEAFGLLGITGASVIAQTSDDIRKFTEELNSAEGTAARVAKDMDDNLGGSFRMMASAAEGVAIAIGESLTPMLRDAMGWVAGLSERFMAWVQRNQAAVETVAVLAGSLLGLAVAFKAAAAATAALKVALSLLMAHPITTTIVGLSSVIALVVRAFGDAENAVTQHAEAMKKAREEGDAARAQHAQMLQRLKELAAKQARTNDEQREAQKIIFELNRAYGGLGLSINSTTGAIEGLAGAEERLTAAMKRRLIEQLRAEAEAMRAQALSKREEAKALGGGSIGARFKAAASFFGLAEDSGVTAERLFTEAESIEAQRRANLQRIADLEAGHGKVIEENLEKRKAETAELERQAAIAKQQADEAEKAAARREVERRAELESLTARLELTGELLDAELMRIEQQREWDIARIDGDTAEQQHIFQRQLRERLLAQQEVSRDRELRAADEDAQIASLQAQLTLEGPELRRRLQEIQHERERAEARLQGDPRDLIFVQHRQALERVLLEKELAGATQRVMNVRGTFSGAAVARGAFDAGGPAEKIVDQLEKLNRKQDAIKKAIEDNAPKAL